MLVWVTIIMLIKHNDWKRVVFITMIDSSDKSGF